MKERANVFIIKNLNLIIYSIAKQFTRGNNNKHGKCSNSIVMGNAN